MTALGVIEGGNQKRDALKSEVTAKKGLDIMAKYYIAYGSNMDFEQMAYRCPHAEYVGTSEVEGCELLFKGSRTGSYATIEENADCKVPVLVWKITESDEENLDRYEGFPIFYYKKNLTITVEGQLVEAMIYIMDEERCLGRPTDHYYGVLQKAYKRFKFDKNILKAALQKSTEKDGGHYVWGQ